MRKSIIDIVIPEDGEHHEGEHFVPGFHAAASPAARARNGSDSESDAVRNEWAWERRSEAFLFEIAKESSKLAHQHTRKARQLKIIYTICAIPTVSGPVLLSSLEDILVNHPLGMKVALMCIAVLTATNGFLDLGGRRARHDAAANLYTALGADINLILLMPRSSRPPADQTLERIKLKFVHIGETAPDVNVPASGRT